MANGKLGKRTALLLGALLGLGVSSARAVEVDLTGQVVKQGGTVSGVSKVPIAPALLYDFKLAGSGNSTGSFVYSYGNGDLATNLEANDVYATLGDTIFNKSGKLGTTFASKSLAVFLSNFPIGPSTSAPQMKVSALVKLKIDAQGFVHVSASKIKYAPKDGNNKPLPFTGTYTVASGGFQIVPSVATGKEATPSLFVPAGHFLNGGSQAFDFLRLSRGVGKTLYLVLKNDGPDSDSFQFVRSPPPTGITAKFYDGATDISSDVSQQSTGFSVTLPSGGAKLIKVVITASSKAAKSNTLFIYFRRAAAPTTRASGQFTLNVN